MKPTGYQRSLVSGVANDAWTRGLISKEMLVRINNEIGGMHRAEVEAIYVMLRDAISDPPV